MDLEKRNSQPAESSTESDGEMEENKVDLKSLNTVNKKKPGIIYLESVPAGFNVSQTTSFFSEFGRVGRIFLNPGKMDKKNGKYNRVFNEGWVEFLSKKIARSVASTLNTTPVGGKRRSKSFDELWNIKYLPGFKWVNLTEQLAYDAAVREKRLRTEISQVKREAEHFKNSVEKKRRKSKKETNSSHEDKPAVSIQFTQRETDSQIRKRKREENVFTVTDIEDTASKKKKTKKSKNSEDKTTSSEKQKSKQSKKAKESGKSAGPDRSEFLKSVFGGGT